MGPQSGGLTTSGRPQDLSKGDTNPTWRNQRAENFKAGSAALAATAVSWNAKQLRSIVGANDRVRIGVVGCGDRMKGALIPAFSSTPKR